MSSLERIAHDLRSPLARARTLAKLLREVDSEEKLRYIDLLEAALLELDQQIIAIVENSNDA